MKHFKNKSNQPSYTKVFHFVQLFNCNQVVTWSSCQECKKPISVLQLAFQLSILLTRSLNIKCIFVLPVKETVASKIHGADSLSLSLSLSQKSLLICWCKLKRWRKGKKAGRRMKQKTMGTWLVGRGKRSRSWFTRRCSCNLLAFLPFLPFYAH